MDFPELAVNGAGRGAMMQPIWSAPKSRQNDMGWNPTPRGGLASTLAGRQFPQVRCFAAGWTVHNKCLSCLHDIVTRDESVQQRMIREDGG